MKFIFQMECIHIYIRYRYWKFRENNKQMNKEKNIQREWKYIINVKMQFTFLEFLLLFIYFDSAVLRSPYFIIILVII